MTARQRRRHLVSRTLRMPVPVFDLDPDEIKADLAARGS